MTQPLGDLLHAQRRDPQRGEFHGQRQPIQLRADVDHGLGRPGAVDGEAGGPLLGLDGRRAPRRHHRRSPVRRPATPARPAMPNGWRLVTITRSAGARASRSTTSRAAPVTACSRVSTTRRDGDARRRDATAPAVVELLARHERGRHRLCDARVLGAVGQVRPPCSADEVRAHVSARPTANRDLPTPPGPLSVSSRVRHSIASSPSSSRARPSSEVSWVGRFRAWSRPHGDGDGVIGRHAVAPHGSGPSARHPLCTWDSMSAAGRGPKDLCRLPKVAAAHLKTPRRRFPGPRRDWR